MQRIADWLYKNKLISNIRQIEFEVVYEQEKHVKLLHKN